MNFIEKIQFNRQSKHLFALWGKTPKQASIIDALAVYILVFPFHLKNQIFKSKFVKTDLAIVDLMITSEMLLQRGLYSDEVFDVLLKNVCSGIISLYDIAEKDLKRVQDNRVKVLGELFHKEGIDALKKETEQLIIHDIFLSPYSDYSLDEPMILCGLDKQIEISVEIQGYFHGLLSILEKELDKYCEVMKRMWSLIE